ncbi:MAG: class I tRNA ligase family protein [Candidatus Heimdallarchaeota archaeon]
MRSKPKLDMKNWNPNIERDIIAYWEKDATFQFNPKTNKPVYIIDTPPPYVSGRAHLGFAIHYAQIDMIARYYRMMGCEVLFPACTDRNGLPVEVKVERKLGQSMHDIDRVEFLKICKIELDEAEENTLAVMKWMGLSCNTFYGTPNIYYQTDSPQYRVLTQRTFIQAWHDGLVYRSTRPNNWCIDCGTTIADAEIEYRNDDSLIHEIKFNLADSDETIKIATTRPELIATCELIIYHPDDFRYVHLEGKQALTPLYSKSVPIFSHPEADPGLGTGIMMICAYGDKSDVKILRDFGINHPKTVITTDGKLNAVAGKYQGKTVKEAQEAILSDLKRADFLIKSSAISRRVPICWRSKTVIEIIGQEEYYLQQVEFLPELRKISELMHFYPQSSQNILENWMKDLSMDWAISRRRFYGTSIPIWYCQKCQFPNVPKVLDRYYEAWKENPPASLSRCSQCGNTLVDAIGEERTFDTWYDSSISELAVCNYGEIFFEDPDQSFFTQNFPCSIRPQGKEIVRTWLYYTILRAYLLFKKSAFKQVWISGLVLDPFGGKMSKSLGNSVDPLVFIQPPNLPLNTPETLKPEIDSWTNIAEKEISNRFKDKNKLPNLFCGADSVRLSSCLQGSHGTDIRFSLDKLNGHTKFITKLWNIARFVSVFPNSTQPSILYPTDEWILSSLNGLINRCHKGYQQLDFSVPAINIYNWVRTIFAAHYIELAKTRAYSDDVSGQEATESAHFTIHYVFKTILKLLAPITPFIAEAIYQKLYEPSQSIHRKLMPESETNSAEEDFRTPKIMELNSLIWRSKKLKKLSFKAPLTSLSIPPTLAAFADDFKAMHNVQKIILSNRESIIYGANDHISSIIKF